MEQQTINTSIDGAQHTIGWFKARLGNITGSSVGKLMGKGRAKDALFSQTGYAYLFQIAAERMIPEVILNDEELLKVYLDEVNVSTKAIRIGNEREDDARELYQEQTQNIVMQVGSCKHPTIPHFASSPDGILESGDGDGCIEIKCPMPSTYMEYAASISCAEDLKTVKPEYYWQCMAHMACTGADFCDFIAYCPYNVKPLHVVRIDRNDEEITAMLEKVVKANEYIEELIQKL